MTLFDALVHGDGRHARRRAEGFLRAAEADVDALAVDIERNSAETGDGVDHQQSAKFIGNFAVGIEALQDARGSLAMREADKFDFPALARAQDILRIDGAAVRNFDADHLGRQALGNEGHALGKSSVGANDALVIRFEHVRNGRFDTARTRCGERESDAVAGLKNAAQQGLDIVHHLGEPRVHVADDGRSHGAVDAGIDAGGPRRQEYPLRRQQAHRSVLVPRDSYKRYSPCRMIFPHFADRRDDDAALEGGNPF